MLRDRDGIIDHFPWTGQLFAVPAPFNDKADLARLAGNPLARDDSTKARAHDWKSTFSTKAYGRFACKIALRRCLGNGSKSDDFETAFQICARILL